MFNLKRFEKFHLKKFHPWFRSFKFLWLGVLSLTCFCLVFLTHLSVGHAQSEDAVETQEDAVIQQYSLPQSPAEAPVVRPQPVRPSAPAESRPSPPSQQRNNTAPAAQTTPSSQRSEPQSVPSEAQSSEGASDSTNPAETDGEQDAALSQYILQFNRAPIVGNALQMEGVLSEARVGFTRPNNWAIDSAKIQIRFRHSSALYAQRSNLTVRLNNQHLGSVPLNRSADEIGNVLFDAPAELLQDYNTIVMQVQQHTSADCTDPTDPTLWTEILPDSQVVMNYRPQPIALDLASYPVPFVNELGLDADQLTYVRPQSLDDVWLTAAARYQASAARLTNFRSIQIRLVEDLEEILAQERLIVIGTPANQPVLSELELPFAIENNAFLDGSGNALPDDVGIVMLTTAQDGTTPVLVMSGNDGKGVLKAVQAIVQPGDRQLLSGPAALISEVATVESPEARSWETFLPPEQRRFELADLTTADATPFQDVTVNGLPVPPGVSIPFKLLPDEELLKGSTFTLRYSYGPNADPRRSSVSISLDGQALGGERLTKADGGTGQLTVDIPPELATPESTLEVQFFTYPRTALSCGNIPDQPMWGTVHNNSHFKLNRGRVFQSPDLRLLQVGFPLAAPQDLSQAAFVMPRQSTDADLLTMLYASSRWGRLSHSDTLKLTAYAGDNLPLEARQGNSLIAVGTRDRLAIPEIWEGDSGFNLGEQFLRRQDQSAVQTLNDEMGVIQAQVSPWNADQIVLALTGQSETGLQGVQQVFARDYLYSQLSGDTVLVQKRAEGQVVSAQEAFRVTTLTENTPRQIDRRSLMGRIVATLQANWFLLPAGVVLLALLFYGLSQVYLNRLSQSREA